MMTDKTGMTDETIKELIKAFQAISDMDANCRLTPQETRASLTAIKALQAERDALRAKNKKLSLEVAQYDYNRRS